MSATRSRKEEKVYKKYQAESNKESCPFCAIRKGDKQFLDETKSFKLIRNIFAYSIWDGQRVTDHIMIVPKKHTDKLEDLDSKEAIEFLKIIGKYEKRGYNMYSRAPSSKIKSVVHQHSHLIKTQGAPKKFLFLLRKPYIRIVF